MHAITSPSRAFALARAAAVAVHGLDRHVAATEAAIEAAGQQELFAECAIESKSGPGFFAKLNLLIDDLPDVCTVA